PAWAHQTAVRTRAASAGAVNDSRTGCATWQDEAAKDGQLSIPVRVSGRETRWNRTRDAAWRESSSLKLKPVAEDLVGDDGNRPILLVVAAVVVQAVRRIAGTDE
ncbi:hypothetical protein, partial [Dokdonella sp.]|uniref:hypothetical protein n=1 Tax=Dokdonella sp. TaxID=2291710 RepID=UPI0025BBC301